MKAVILAGGAGTRLAEETSVRPKPMVTIGSEPILWHIMKLYAHAGVTEFVIAVGYKGYLIKEYFANYRLHRGDVTINLGSGTVDYHRVAVEPWRVTLVDTGDETMTGGRLRRLRPYLDPDEPFFMTYGDGVCDLDLQDQASFHVAHGRLATITAIRPPGRFGALSLSGSNVTGFLEKPLGDGNYINGGFFVLSPRVLDLIGGDSTVWEQEPLEALVAQDQLQAYRHDGFWQCMDNMRDKLQLEERWNSGQAPWKNWA